MPGTRRNAIQKPGKLGYKDDLVSPTEMEKRLKARQKWKRRQPSVTSIVENAVKNSADPSKQTEKISSALLRKLSAKSSRKKYVRPATHTIGSPEKSPNHLPMIRSVMYKSPELPKSPLAKSPEKIISLAPSPEEMVYYRYNEDGSPISTTSYEPLYGLHESESLLIHPNVGGIVERLQKIQAQRLETDVKGELQEIRHRVNQALKNVDFLFENEEEQEEEKSNIPLSLKSNKREEELDHQAEVKEVIEGMIEGYHISQSLLDDVERWFDEVKSMGLDESMDEEMVALVANSNKMRNDVFKSLTDYGNASNKMVKLGQKVMKEAGNIIKENEADMKKMKEKLKDKITIYDEQELMVDALKWEKAMKLVHNTFDDALKWTKNVAFRNCYMKTQKQFKNLSSAMHKKILDLNGKQREVDGLKKKLLDTKASAEKKNKELDELKKNMRKLSREAEDKAKLLSMQEKKNQTLQEKLLGTEQRVKSMEREHIAMESAVKQEMEQKEKELAAAKTAAEAPPPPPKIQKAIIKVLDPEMVQKLKDAEEELERNKRQITDMTDRISDLERLLRREREKIKHLREDLEKAEREAEQAAMTVTIPDPVKEAVETSEGGEKDTKDSSYYKKLLKGMKKDFAVELEKLKAHLQREKQRSVAAGKRQENNHKDQLFTIQKDVVRVLRAIMHFRDHVCTLMQKENLKDLVHNMQQLGSLIPDKLAPDPKDVLSHLVSDVVDYMHKMEVIISNAFLAMRMMIKGSVPDPMEQAQRRVVEAKVKVKDAQTRMTTMDTAKTETVQLARRLMLAKEKLVKLEQVTDEEAKDKKYHGLLDRYHMVWQMYNRLQKDMDVLQTDFQSSIEEKIKEQDDLMITNVKLAPKKKENTEKDLKLSITNLKDNLRLLEKAYEDNKISKDLYLMATATLRKAMHIPEKRLKYLFEQYIAFKNVKEVEERLENTLIDPDVPTDVKADLEVYIKRMRSKININMDVWHKKIKELEKDRKSLNESIWKLFNEVLAETGVLLVHPMFKKNTKTGQVYSKMAHTLRKETLKKVLRNRNRVGQILKLPPVLCGNTVSSNLRCQQNDMWRGDGQGDNVKPCPMVNTPHMLNYDVNKPRILANRVVKEDPKRGSFTFRRGGITELYT